MCIICINLKLSFLPLFTLMYVYTYALIDSKSYIIFTSNLHAKCLLKPSKTKYQKSRKGELYGKYALFA